jgi:hypothetical protein
MSLWKLVFKLNSKRKTYAGRHREAKYALYGALVKEPEAAWEKPASLLAKYADVDPWDLTQEYKSCRDRTGSSRGSWSRGCFVSGKLWWYPAGGVRGITEGDNLDKASQANDKAFGLLRSAAQPDRAPLQLGENSSSDESGLHPIGQRLADMEKANVGMDVVPEFEDLWDEYEEELKENWPNGNAMAQLQDLLQALPVAHVDEASPLRLSNGGSLLERCAFRMVAASIKSNFPEALPLVLAQRVFLELPTPERAAGEDADVSTLFDWIARGQPEGEIRRGPDDRDDIADPSFQAWLSMMAAENLCDSRGRAGVPSLEDPEYEDLDEEAEAAAELDEEAEAEASAENPQPTVQWVAPPPDVLDGKGVAEGRASANAWGDPNACYEVWMASDIAARLKDFLDRELSRQSQ